MADVELVEDDIKAADALVDLLEEKDFPLKAALWLFQAAAERWRFVLCPVEKRKDPTTFYKDFARVVNATGHPREFLDLNRVDIVTEESPLIKVLGRAIRVEGRSHMRVQDSSFNGVFLEDALIYKLSA